MTVTETQPVCSPLSPWPPMRAPNLPIPRRSRATRPVHLRACHGFRVARPRLALAAPPPPLQQRVSPVVHLWITLRRPTRSTRHAPDPAEPATSHPYSSRRRRNVHDRILLALPGRAHRAHACQLRFLATPAGVPNLLVPDSLPCRASDVNCLVHVGGLRASYPTPSTRRVCRDSRAAARAPAPRTPYCRS